MDTLSGDSNPELTSSLGSNPKLVQKSHKDYRSSVQRKKASLLCCGISVSLL